MDHVKPSLDVPTACRYSQQGLRLMEADYLRRTGSFVPPLNTAESCWRSYQTLAEDFYPNFDLRRNCGFETNWIAVPGCMNITNRQQFETTVGSLFNTVVSACNQSLSGSSCSSCTVALSNLQASYLNGESVGNLTDCRAYPFIYAAAFVNHFGPTDRGTAVCLFSIDISFTKSKNKHKTIIFVIISVIITILLLAIAIGFRYHRRKKLEKLNRKRRNKKPETNSVSALDSITSSTTLIKFTIDDIKEAPRNFSRENIIGRGGYGNVYKGVLPDDSEVALKRFKNCSADGDASFTHEVEALLGVVDGQPVLLADWAWSMVRSGTPLEVIDDGMAECDPPEIMEKYVLVAVLSSHPQLYARPMMDQVLKMLDADLPVPSIPERPIPLTAGIEDIERSVNGRSVATEEVEEEEEEVEDEKARLSGGR
ncbi:hypothetical protein L1987_21856 [Smallanthus sonchifolius]|uniref:Uncharacterized protein n=1 Tax=Smallanthus sonchifolius TaxID=185202 RepID=A0ACB9IEJ7_9ASTR|nr:hypothetical protein L1987_21856 [Smallanthus sonchifolius]